MNQAEKQYQFSMGSISEIQGKNLLNPREFYEKDGVTYSVWTGLRSKMA